MRKFLKIFCCFIFIALIVFMAGFVSPKLAFAEETESNFLVQEIRQELLNFIENDSVILTRANRTAGSQGELMAASYIYSRLDSFGLTKTNAYGFNNGVMTVEYVKNNGEFASSKNISFTLSSSTENAKTVILLTHYDNFVVTGYNADGQEVKNFETINQSSGTVAMMLTLANYLASSGKSFDFNIEFVFVGASLEDNAGANQVEILRANNKENILLVMMFDRITIGDYNYVYCGDVASNYSKIVENELIGANNFSKFNAVSSTYFPEDDYTYYNAGKTDAFDIFYEAGFNTAHVFSGFYEGLESFGKTESATHNQLTGTIYDSIYGIEKEYSELVSVNLSKVLKGTLSLLCAENISSKIEPNEQANLKLAFFKQPKFMLLCCGIIVVVFVVICGIIFFKLSKNADKRATGEDIDQIVLNITTKLGVNDNPELKQKIREKVENEKNKTPKT